MRVCIMLVLCVLCLFPSEAWAGETKTIIASWYGPGCGKHTADGTAFSAGDPSIAAHRTLPFGTVLTVTNPENGRSLQVVVHDRGPFVAGRSLDLTRAGAEALGYLQQGVAKLSISIGS